jgi:sorbitol-specific phosphotransferase system component IIC
MLALYFDVLLDEDCKPDYEDELKYVVHQEPQHFPQIAEPPL